MKSENERCGIKLSEDLRYWRAERPDEWTMDRFIREAEKMEKQLQNTSHNSDYAKLKDALEDIASAGGSLTGEDAQVEMKYNRPEIPRETIEYCISYFDRKEAVKRICDYIESQYDIFDMWLSLHIVQRNYTKLRHCKEIKTNAPHE